MSLKNKIVIEVIAYIALMTGFAFFWANCFGWFIHHKGDDFEWNIFICTGLTYLFNFIYYFTLTRINIYFFMLVPILIAVLAIPVGFLLMMTLAIGGTPAQITYLYTFTYLFLSLIAILITFRKCKFVEVVV
jgi:hypothetical protein